MASGEYLAVGKGGTVAVGSRRTSSTGVPLAIPRAFDADEDGIVYIGSGRLRKRIGDLLPAISGKLHHNFGDTYDYYGFKRLCPYDRLEIQWAEVLEGIDCKKVEGALSVKYTTRFLSIPPGNMIAPGRG